jgi:hypothetical protein
MKALMLAVLAIGLLLFGCTGSEPQNSQSDNSQAPASPQATQSPQPQAPSHQPTAQAPEQSKEKLISMVSSIKTLSYSVEYEISSSNMNFSTTIYVKGEKERTDMTTFAGTWRTYVIFDKIYQCTKTNGTWSCIDNGKTVGRGIATKYDENGFPTSLSDFDISSAGTKQIAGTTANCFEAAHDKDLKDQYCFSSEGVPLYIDMQVKMTNGVTSTSRTIAKTYSMTVDDSVFVLPATPTKKPGT